MAKRKNDMQIVSAELQDLSRELQEIAISKEGCFYKYREKREIGEKIYADIMNKYERDGNTFKFSDDVTESGLLSQLQGFATVISIHEGFGLNAKDKKMQKFIDAMLDYLFDKVVLVDGYRIDASPYLADNTSIFEKYHYLDSITWIISALLGVMRFHINGSYVMDLDSERGKKFIDLYKFCLNYINDSFIENDRISKKLNCGWNFTKNCEEPSLYFTFAVSELLIDILNTFENVIRTADVDLIKEGIHNEIDKDNLLLSDRYKQVSDRLKAILDEAKNDNSFEGYGDALSGFTEFTDEEKAIIIEIHQKEDFVEKEYAKHTERIAKNSEDIQREVELFRLINNNCQVYVDNSPYAILESCCKKSANKIWDLTRDGLATEFYSFNLESKISESVIANSVSSDAVFNVIFAINVLINAGIDEDYEDKINYFTMNGSDAYQNAMAEYDNMRDTIRLAYDNCYQCFMRLKKVNKEYKISEYTLNFDETFVKHAYNVKEIRKAHIRVFSLMPLMVRTKTTIGEFLIKFPQYDMILYLENILKYRCWNEEEGQYIWLWENDGYSTSSNYYFVSAFAAFYAYYDTYEAIFHNNVKGNKKAQRDIEDKFLKGLQEKGMAVDLTVSAFTELKQTIATKDSEIEAMKAQIERYENDPLRSALNQFIEEALQKTIIEILAQRFSQEAARIVSEAKVRVRNAAKVIEEENGTDHVGIKDWKNGRMAEGTIESGMRDMILATMFADQLGEAMYSVKLTKAEREDSIGELEKHVKKTDRDIKQAIRYYLQGIAEGGKSSHLVANEGESSLPLDMHIRLMNMLEKQNNKGDDK